MVSTALTMNHLVSVVVPLWMWPQMYLSLQLSSLTCAIYDLGKVKSHIRNVDNNNNIYCTVICVCVCVMGKCVQGS